MTLAGTAIAGDERGTGVERAKRGLLKAKERSKRDSHCQSILVAQFHRFAPFVPYRIIPPAARRVEIHPFGPGGICR
jgi:hypothetical protein